MTEVDRNWLREKVLYCGMPLREVKQRYPYNFLDDMEMLQKCRKEYLIATNENPKERVNYYICGDYYSGKTVFSKILAKLLKGTSIKVEEDLYYSVGMSGVTGYDGQEIIIWDDYAPEEFINTVGGYNCILKVLGNTAEIREGLNNRINIITSTLKFPDYLNRLAGEYGNKRQLGRRLPFFIDLGNTIDRNSNLEDVIKNKEYTFGRRVIGGKEGVYKLSHLKGIYVKDNGEIKYNMSSKFIKEHYIKYIEQIEN